MNVLGLDMSTCAGAAIVDSLTKKVIHAEEIQFKKLTGFPRVEAIVARCLELRDKHHCPAIIIEDYAVSKFGGAVITSIEIGTVLRFCLWQDSFPYLTVTPSSLKKFVTGKGNAKKELMIMEVFDRWKYRSATNNIADAVSLAMFGAQAVTPSSLLRKDSSLVVSTALKTQPEFLAAVRRRVQQA